MELLKKIQKAISSLVHNKIFTIVMNIVIIVSIIFILVVKIIDVDPETYSLLSNLDIIILIIFSIDFSLRFIAGGKEYFLKEYGWIDLLAVLPIINPVVKGLRIIRVLRTLRFLRMLRFLRIVRVLKVVKSVDVSANKHKQDLSLIISSVLMLMLILGGGVIIIFMEYILTNHDIATEQAIFRTVDQIEDKKEAKVFLQSQEQVIKVYELMDYSKDDPFLTSKNISGDIHVEEYRKMRVYFSRKQSRRQLGFLEAMLILGIFCITMIIIIIMSIKYDQLLVDTGPEIGSKMRE